MNNKIIIALLCLFCSTGLIAQNYTIHVDTVREYRLHLPKLYNPSNSYPLLVAFHGGFGINRQFENETSFSDLADTANIIVVYPQAIGSTRSWNTGSCCGWAFNNGIDDIQFIKKLLDTLKSTYNVDSTRVYATGFSSGAMMTYAVACKLSNYFTAIAPISSSMIIDKCSPDCTPMPIIHLHAELDSSALFYGGISSNPILQFYYPPVDSVLTEWSIKNDCDTLIDTIVLTNGTRIYRWNNCANNSYQEIWLADDGGHKWPGTSDVGILSGDMATQDFNATEVVWSFLRQFQKSCTTTSIQETSLNPMDYSIYPNPVHDILTIKGDLSKIRQMELYNNFGGLLETFTSRNSIPMARYNGGIYFLKLRIDNTVKVFKLVKQ